MRKLRLAGVGCGARTRTYLSLIAAHHPNRFSIVAAADPIPQRVAAIRELAGDARSFREFASADELFDAREELDVVIIGTQDAAHFHQCMRAIECGYDVLLEKPIALTFPQVLRLRAAAAHASRRVVVCHVLRYTPFYTRIRALIGDGAVGRVHSIHATEGVGPWHFAHSYVRGHWRSHADAAPMIVAKSCHDTDILHWLVDSQCTRVASTGTLRHFRSDRAPDGATARCTDGCPHLGSCPFDAHRYLTDQRRWLALVYDRAQADSDENIHAWLRESSWGRCVYHSDNDAPDHQLAQFSFSSGASASLTVTAFATGRSIEVFGEEGVLRAGSVLGNRDESEPVIALQAHAGGRTQLLPLHDGRQRAGGDGYEGHFGGDRALVDALYDEFTTSDTATMVSSIDVAVEGHLMAFAAEAARTEGRVVDLSDPRFRRDPEQRWVFR